MWAQWGLEGLGLVPEPCTFQSASWGCRPSVSEPSWDPGPHLSLEVRQCQLLSVLVNPQLNQLTAKSIAQMRKLSTEKGRGARVHTGGAEVQFRPEQPPVLNPE